MSEANAACEFRPSKANELAEEVADHQQWCSAVYHFLSRFWSPTKNVKRFDFELLTPCVKILVLGKLHFFSER